MVRIFPKVANQTKNATPGNVILPNIFIKNKNILPNIPPRERNTIMGNKDIVE
jgi:hypothetical protein